MECSFGFRKILITRMHSVSHGFRFTGSALVMVFHPYACALSSFAVFLKQIHVTKVLPFFKVFSDGGQILLWIVFAFIFLCFKFVPL